MSNQDFGAENAVERPIAPPLPGAVDVAKVDDRCLDRRQPAGTNCEILQIYKGNSLIGDAQARGAVVGPAGRKREALDTGMIETSPARSAVQAKGRRRALNLRRHLQQAGLGPYESDRPIASGGQTCRQFHLWLRQFPCSRTNRSPARAAQ